MYELARFEFLQINDRDAQLGGAVTGGENVRGWTVAEENANAFSFALEADEQGVWLVARPKGTVLLLR